MSTEYPKEAGSKPRTGSTSNLELDRQEKALLAILDGADPFVEGGAEGARRDDLEVMGLMAKHVAPVTPRAESKEALFRRLNLSQDPASGGPEAVLPFRGREQRSTANHGPNQLPNATRPSSWMPWALAATVLLAVGLGAWSGFLFSELRQSRTLVAGLESELGETSLPNVATGEYQQVLFENQRLRQQIGMTTMPKTRVCSLSATAPEQPKAKGTIFLRPQDGSWVMATSDLAKCDRGRRYRLWFLGDGGDVIGGEVLEHVNGDQRIEIASGDLPQGTSAIMVTLEFPDKFGSEPGGERVLYGDRSVEIF